MLKKWLSYLRLLNYFYRIIIYVFFYLCIVYSEKNMNKKITCLIPNSFSGQEHFQLVSEDLETAV